MTEAGDIGNTVLTDDFLAIMNKTDSTSNPLSIGEGSAERRKLSHRIRTTWMTT